MPTLKPVYLVHGDDHGAIAERRTSLKALGERLGGSSAVEILSGEDATPRGVSASLSTMTFALGGDTSEPVRVIIVDGVERWKQAEIESDLKPALEGMPEATTLALFAREEARSKVPAILQKLVQAAGGQIVAHATVKPWELPRWVKEQAPRLGLELDSAAAKALVEQVGERQQRLLRELEKLSLELVPLDTTGQQAGDVTDRQGESAEAAGGGKAGARRRLVRVSAEDVEARASSSAERKAYTLADALLYRDRARALAAALELESQGESLSGLLYLIASRFREAIAVAERLQQGESPATVKRSLRMPPKAAERFVATMADADTATLRDALGVLADLELDLRGGERLAPQSRPDPSLSERSLALRTIVAIAH